MNLNVIAKRHVFTDLGKIAGEVLKLTKVQNDNINSIIPQRNVTKNHDTLTDVWLRDALKKKNNNLKKNNAVLSIFIVLKTLQRLRTSDKPDLYFTLFNRIITTEIDWISMSNKNLLPSKELPLEFYHELSNMLYKLSLKKEDKYKITILAKYCLDLITNYQIKLKKTPKKFIHENTKFYRNCIEVICSTQSVIIMEATLTLLNNASSSNFLKKMAFICYYNQTNQIPLLMEYLEDHILSGASSKFNNIEVFSSLFSKIVQKLIIFNAEEICTKLLSKLENDLNIKFSEHDYSIFNELSERYSTSNISTKLKALYPDRTTELTFLNEINKNSNLNDIISELNNKKIDPFEVECALPFIQTKFHHIGKNEDDWKDYLEANNIPEETPIPLKTLFVNSVLSSILSLGGGAKLFLSVFNHLLFNMDYLEAFLNSARLKGQENLSGFHLLFVILGRNSSTKLTIKGLYEFLNCNDKIRYKFCQDDYTSIFKSLIASGDVNSVSDFFLTYIENEEKNLRSKRNCSYSWELPLILQSLLTPVNNNSIVLPDFRNMIKKIKSNIESGERVNQNLQSSINLNDISRGNIMGFLTNTSRDSNNFNLLRDINLEPEIHDYQTYNRRIDKNFKIELEVILENINAELK